MAVSASTSACSPQFALLVLRLGLLHSASSPSGCLPGTRGSPTRTQAGAQCLSLRVTYLPSTAAQALVLLLRQFVELGGHLLVRLLAAGTHLQG
jgi:hypothetical protein